LRDAGAVAHVSTDFSGEESSASGASLGREADEARQQTGRDHGTTKTHSAAVYRPSATSGRKSYAQHQAPLFKQP